MDRRDRPLLSRRHGTATLCLLLAGALPAQRVPQRVVESTIDFATSQDDNLFSLLRSQDHIHLLQEGLAAIAAGELRPGVERLHRLLQVDNGGVVPVAPGRFLGLRLATVLTLANLPPAAREAYEAMVRAEGGAVGDLHELAAGQLLLLAERFPAADLGVRARLRLGDLALVAGDGIAAAAHFRSALDGVPIGSRDERRIADRLHLAAVLCDPAAARADAAAGRLGAAGGDVLAVLPPRAATAIHPALGGGASGRTPMTPPAGAPTTRWTEEVMAPGFGQRDIGLFAMHAVGDLDGVFLNTGREVIAFDPLRRAVQWVSLSPLRDADDARRDRWRRRGGDDDGINQDMVLAATCNSDVVVAALQVPENSMNVDFNGGFRVMSKIPQRRLFAFSRQSGKVLWSHFDELDGPRTRRFRGHDACSSPLIAGDTVYVPVHDRSGAIAFAIAAYDLSTGQPKWRRLVCSSQQDVNMFGNARSEFAASPLCLHDGILYGSSNLGVAFALEAATGRLRWITAYEVVRMPRAMLHHQIERQVFFANNPPVVADGVVCTTPLDSQFVLGLDTENGRILWTLPAEASAGGQDHRVLWLCGAFGDEFVLTGAGAVAVRARPEGPAGQRAEVRSLVAPDRLGDRRSGVLPPRPAITADAIWFPQPDRLQAFGRDGRPHPGTPALPLPRYVPGNLLLIGGIVVSVGQHAFEVAYDGESLLQHVLAQAAAAPDDPEALLRVASLRRALLGEQPSAAALAQVQQLYRQGLDACLRAGMPKTHPVRQALQRELFEQALANARAALERRAGDAAALLAAARDVAPDGARWVEVQALMLELHADRPAAYRAELDRLLAEAPEARFPTADGVPVRAWVAWQLARIETEPAAAVARWQQLLEVHGAVPLGEATAAAIAQDAIAALVARHGPQCYAPIAAAADAALTAAGDDAAALGAVVARWPNSAAAARARTRLLDAAVRAGDLAAACGVLVASAQAGPVPPGVLRRVTVAAIRRGNLALAASMTARLRQYAGDPSDWPDDAGVPYGRLPAPPAPAAAPGALQVPAAAVGAVVPEAAGDFLLPLPQLETAGFAAAADTPLYVRAGRDLMAVDVHAAGRDKPVLFRTPVEFVEHVLVCGTTLVVPDLARVFAIDHRTGAPRWELPNPRRRQLESLGVLHGVLHLYSPPPGPNGHAELLGVEPLTGAVLFQQAQPAAAMQPKVVADGLLRLVVGADGGALLELLDPVTGTAARSFAVAAAALQPLLTLAVDSMRTRLFPQWLAAAGDGVFLPVEATAAGETPHLLAVGADGAIAWRWSGTRGAALLLAALAGDAVVVAEGGDRRPGRLCVLRAADGKLLREVELGIDPARLNWEPSWQATPLPPVLAFESFADPDRGQRQLVCVDLAPDGSAFVVPLGADGREVLATPQFGPDFVTFGVRPGRGGGGLRLFALRLRDRAGAFPGGQKFRAIDLPGTIDGMTTAGPYIVLSGAQGLQLLGDPGTPR